MKRGDFLAFGASALLVIGFADWLFEYRHKEAAQPRGLNANALLNASGMTAEAAIQQTLLGEGTGSLSGSWGSPSGGDQL